MPRQVIRKLIGVVVAVLGVVHRLADAVEAIDVHVRVSPIHGIRGHGREPQLLAEIDTMIVLKSSSTQAVETHSSFVDPVRRENMSPRKPGVLPSVDSVAAVARQAGEGIDGVEGIKRFSLNSE